MRLPIVFGCGVLFAVGLGISGMLRPEKVIAFLEFQDPSLLFVMGPAVAIYAMAAWERRRHEHPIDRPLVAGAAIFGVGWGLTGICPGPAIVNLAKPDAYFVAFIAAIVAGIFARALLRKVSA